MSDFVNYSKELMDCAKQFAADANSAKTKSLVQAYRRSALMHGFCFLEAELNYLAEHFEGKPMFTVHEQGVLLERDVRLKKGKFVLSDREKFYRLLERIELLLEKCAHDADSVKANWFSSLSSAIKKRNKLVHPREAHSLSDKEVKEVLQAILDGVSALYGTVLKRKYPYKNKGLDVI